MNIDEKEIVVMRREKTFRICQRAVMPCSAWRAVEKFLFIRETGFESFNIAKVNGATSVVSRRDIAGGHNMGARLISSYSRTTMSAFPGMALPHSPKCQSWGVIDRCAHVRPGFFGPHCTSLGCEIIICSATPGSTMSPAANRNEAST